MAYRERQKISQMTPKGADLEATDLIEVSTLVSGSYVTKSLTGQEIINLIPDISGYVPYVGATQDVDLDANKLSARSIYIEGTGGNGHLHLKHQSADATATGQSTSLWADTNGDIKWKNDGDYKTTLKTSDNTADRTYTFRNQSGTVALQEIEIDQKTINYTLALSDAYKLIEVNSASNRTVTIPLNSVEAFPIGTQIIIAGYGTGEVKLAGSVGVTILSSGAKLTLNAQYSMATIIKRATNEWYLSGDLKL